MSVEIQVELHQDPPTGAISAITNKDMPGRWCLNVYFEGDRIIHEHYGERPVLEFITKS